MEPWSHPFPSPHPLQTAGGCYGIRWTHFVTWQNSVAYISGVANVQHWLARPTGKLATGPSRSSGEPAQAQLMRLHNPSIYRGCHTGGCCSSQETETETANQKQNQNCTCCCHSVALTGQYLDTKKYTYIHICIKNNKRVGIKETNYNRSSLSVTPCQP